MGAVNMGRVQGKSAIVTGGAAGIGRAIAALLHREGASVLITDIRPEGSATAMEIGCDFLLQDVADEAGWDVVIASAEKRYGKIDILVNNAGIGECLGQISPEDTSLADWQRTHRVNSEGVFLGCRAVIPAMKRAGGGSIINMSSLAALVSTPFLTAYGASKAAVRQLTMSVAIHCAQSGYRIRCNSVHPGQIKTDMFNKLVAHFSQMAGMSFDEMEKEWISRVPLAELGEPEDIAYGVLYLASDESKHVTGTKLVIDGGIECTVKG
jgi:NAD(P)-dependent dehydrogenase (short-subunit alcohol dehydrogenase family)